MIPRELLKKIRRIEIRTKRSVNDLFAGQYHSAFKGRGMEFQEVREYQPGDEIRTIDWNVTARQGRPFVKLFREERELTVFLLVDVSRSHLFGTSGQAKRDLTAEIGAVLAFSAIQNNDKVGLISFSDRVEQYVPPKKGLRHVLRVVRELLMPPESGHGTDISVALAHLRAVTHRRAVVFLISDFQADRFELPMRVAGRRHDLVPLMISDPREREMPDVGFVELLDLEARRRVVVDTGSRRWRDEYRRQSEAQRARARRMFRRLNLDAIEITTGQPYAGALAQFFHMRGRKR